MEFKGRALYNILQISVKEDSSIRAEPWQILDYRSLSEEELLQRLYKLHPSLNKENFFLYAETCQSPEELVECLWLQEEDLVGQEKTYLLLFEFWRRCLPGRQSLSIFCDELDALISQFDEGVDMEDEKWHVILSELEDILDRNTDLKTDPKEIFTSILQYTAHDIERFLYDYIFELIEEENEILATSLIEAFDDYVLEKKWLSLLRARLLSSSRIDVWTGIIHRLLEEEEENPNLPFLMEVFSLLKEQDDAPLFFKCIKQILPIIKPDSDLQELLQDTAEFCRNLHKDSLEKSILNILQKKAFNTKEIEKLLSTS
ncbi:MAG: hypothetical protein V4489_01670 [Chlamydiota bacterium]